jgi:hypothetical protein
MGHARKETNQLSTWEELGILKGLPSNPLMISKMPLWEDKDAELTNRARGYLDVNCAHCHSPKGSADNSGLFLEYSRPLGYAVGKCKPPVAAGAGSGDLRYIIVPGKAQDSILSFRVHSNKIDVRMPEIGRTVIHTEGAKLVEDWINSLVPESC